MSEVQAYACAAVVRRHRERDVVGSGTRSGGVTTAIVGGAMIAGAGVYLNINPAAGRANGPGDWALAGAVGGAGLITVGVGVIIYFVGAASADDLAERFRTVPDRAPRADPLPDGRAVAEVTAQAASRTRLPAMNGMSLAFPF
jgi:hypothetical protein